MVSAIKVGGRRAPRARPGGRGGRARAAAGSHRRARGRGRSSPAPYPEATIRVECSSGTYIRTLAADLGDRARGLRAPRRAAAPARRVVHPRRGPPARRDRGRSRRARAHARRVALRDLDRRRGRRASSRARSRTARSFAAPRAARRSPTSPVRSRSSTTDGSLLAVYERRGAGVKPAVVLAPQGRVIIWRDPAKSARGRRGDARGRRSARSTACTSATKPCCASCTTSRARAASTPTVLTFDRHPAEVVRPGVRAEAAHHARPEARAARRDGLGRRVPACSRSTRRAARSRPKSSSSEVLAGVLGARLVVVGADFHFGHRRARRRRAARAHGRGARLRGDRARARRSPDRRTRPTAGVPVLVDPDPRAARARATSRGAAGASRPSARGARHRRARRPARPRARVPDRQRRGARARLPPRRRRVRRDLRRRATASSARRDLARAPADLLRRAGLLAARGLRARLRRRPLRPARPRCASPPPARPGAVRLGRRPRRPDAPRRRTPPIRRACEPPERTVDRERHGERIDSASACGSVTRLYPNPGRRLTSRMPDKAATISDNTSARHRHRFGRRCRSRCSPSASTT